MLKEYKYKQNVYSKADIHINNEDKAVEASSVFR